MSYKAMAHIHSLNGEMAEITVLEEVGDNDYIVDYKGVKCELHPKKCTDKKRLNRKELRFIPVF